jgi:hypothetical protein
MREERTKLELMPCTFFPMTNFKREKQKKEEAKMEEDDELYKFNRLMAVDNKKENVEKLLDTNKLH